MDGSVLERAFTRAEEALLARTLVGRKLVRGVQDAAGVEVFHVAEAIDRPLLDRARQLGLLEEVARAAEPGTSDTELEDLFVWLADLRGRRR